MTKYDIVHCRQDYSRHDSDGDDGESTCTVKPVCFACPLFHECHDLGNFAKIAGHNYAVVSVLLSSASNNAKIKSTKII